MTATPAVRAYMALAISIAVPEVSHAEPPQLCPCMELESTVESVGLLGRMDWRSVDRSRLAELWPAISCEPVAEGPGSQGELTERCCQSCGTCGGQMVVKGLDTSLVRLRSIGVLVCRETRDDVVRTIKRLIDVAVPEKVDASYESPPSDLLENQRFMTAYRWQLREETSLLDASIYSWRDKRWVGTFTLSRCPAPQVLEQWVLDDGSMIDVTRISLNDTDHDRWVNFSYVSECVLVDRDCILSEGERLWPRLKPLAERDRATAVAVYAESCWADTNEVTYAKIGGDWVSVRD